MYSITVDFSSVLYCSAAGGGLTNIMENHTFVPRAHYFRLLRRRRRYEPQYHSVLRLCSEFRDSRSFLCFDIKQKNPRQKSMHKKKCGEIRQGPQCLLYIREYPDFGDTNPLVKPVVLCDAGVNMFKAVVKFEHPRIPAFQPFMKPVSYFLRKQFHAVQCLYQL